MTFVEAYATDGAGGTEGPIGVYTWKDEAWAEYHQRLSFYYWDDAQSLWIEYAQTNRTLGIGLHRENAGEPERSLTEIVDRRDFGAPPGLHVACGNPYFAAWDVNATWTCSDIIRLD